MKQIEFYGACNVEKAWHMLQQEADESGDLCCGEFNGEKLLSSDSLDEAYMKVTGKTKAEHDALVQKRLDELKRQREDAEASKEMMEVNERYDRQMVRMSGFEW